MKNPKKTSQSQTSNIQNMEHSFSLFESLVATEQRAAAEAEINKYCTRVGMVLRVLTNRGLSAMQIKFEDEVTKLVQRYCSEIDNVLCSSEEDSKSEI